jgi:hypothetical protein
MTGLEVLLFVYLAGWVGTSSYQAYQCDDSHRHMTKSECRVVAAVGGSMWPAMVYHEFKGE